MNKTPPLSLNETAFYITRAASGAGVPWGAAEDLARTAQAIARAGEDPAPDIADALTRLDSGESGAQMNLNETDSGGELAAEGAGALSAVCAAPAVCDWLIEHAGAEGARLAVRRADVPRLITAAAAALPEHVRAVWAAETPAPDELVFTRRAAPETPAPETPAPETSAPRPVQRGGACFDAAAWEVIQTFFRRCLAPSTEASRLSSAGAGVNDTD